MMMARTNTAARADMPVILAATASASASGARGGRGPYLLFYVTGDDFLRIRLRPGIRDIYGDTRWIDDTFAALEARLSAPLDQDVFDEAEKLALRLSSKDKLELSDEWIESISDHWSKFRD